MTRTMIGVIAGIILCAYLERAWWAQRLINYIFTADTREPSCRTHRTRSSSA